MEKKERHRALRKCIAVFVLTLSIVTAAGVGLLYVRDRIVRETSEAGFDRAPDAVERAEFLSEVEEVLPADPAAEGDAPARVEEAADGEVAAGKEDAADAVDAGAPEMQPDPYADVEEDFFTRRVQAAEPDAVTMAFAGDILFDASYAIQARIPQDAGIAGAVGASLLAEMNRVDLMVINNEFPYTDRGAPQEEKTFTFHARPKTVRQLKEMGADLVSLANNHTFDYGEEGFLDTLDTLDRAGVARVGAGRDLAEASHPMTFLVNGMKLAVVAATQIERYPNPNTRGATDTLPGVFRCMDDALLCERVREAKAESDFVIVFIHWGTENEEQPDWLQLKQAPEIADAGADLIIGCHSHCLQPVDIVNGVPVVYSLGNFLFNSKTLDTCLIECEIERKASPDGETASAANGGADPGAPAAQTVSDGSQNASAAPGDARLKSLRFLPCIQSGCAVRFAGGEEKERILQYMRDISPGIEINEEGEISLREP